MIPDIAIAALSISVNRCTCPLSHSFTGIWRLSRKVSLRPVPPMCCRNSYKQRRFCYGAPIGIAAESQKRTQRNADAALCRKGGPYA